MNHLPIDDEIEISLNVLHASAIRAMSSFVQQPRPEVAETVVKLLHALAQHPERFQARCGHDIYPQALQMWIDLAQHMREYCKQQGAGSLH